MTGRENEENFDPEGGRWERPINELNSLAQEPVKLIHPTPFTQHYQQRGITASQTEAEQTQTQTYSLNSCKCF